MIERELLVRLYNFVISRQFVQGEKESIKDMVVRYKSPPFTMAYPICMRLSVKEYNDLNELLKQAQVLLAPPEEVTPKMVGKVELKPDDTA